MFLFSYFFILSFSSVLYPTEVGNHFYCTKINPHEVGIGRKSSKSDQNSYETAYVENTEERTYIIPETIHGYTVTHILPKAFQNCPSQFIEFPYSLKYIGHEAFMDSKFATMSFRNTQLVEIGDKAFKSCSELSYISLPKTLEILGSAAFQNCEKLIRIDFYPSIKSLGMHCLQSCTKIQRVDLSNSTVTIIPQYAFSHCILLRTLILPETCVEIHRNAFMFTRALRTLEFPKNLTLIQYRGFFQCGLTVINLSSTKIKYIEKETFMQNHFVETLILPRNLLNLGKRAFKHCPKLETVEFPPTITEMSAQCFETCGTLRKINISHTKINYFSSQVFKDCSSLTEVITPAMIFKIEFEAFYCCKSLAKITIPMTLNVLEKYAFYQCSSLKEINLVNTSLDTINSYCFSGSGLTTFSSPMRLRIIKDHAFHNITSLESFKFSNELQKIEIAAFSLCTGLKLVDIQNTVVTEIPDDCFNSTYSLEKITFNSKITKLGERCFFNAKSLTTITASKGLNVDSLPDDAFYGCIKLSSFSFAKTIKKVGHRCFFGCEALNNVNMNEIQQCQFGDSVFQNCVSLKKLTLPQKVTSYGSYFVAKTKINNFPLEKISSNNIPEGAFMDCEQLNSIIIPPDIEYIGPFAFMGCKILTSIDLSETRVKRLENSTFQGCIKLSHIRFNNLITKLGSSCFAKTHIDALEKFASMDSISSSCFDGCLFIESIDFNNLKISKIHDFTFANCTNLNSVTFSQNIVSIGSMAFANTSIKILKIPYSVKFLSNYAFAFMNMLESVDISDCSFDRVSDYCFMNDRNLKFVHIKDPTIEYPSNIFEGCPSASLTYKS